MTFWGAHLIQVIGHLDCCLTLDCVLFQFSEEYGKGVWIHFIWGRLSDDLPCIWSPSYFNLRKMFHLRWVLSLAAWCGLAWMMWQKLRVTLWKKAKTSSVSIHVGTAWLRLCSQAEKVKKPNLWEAYLCLYLRKIHTHIKCICAYAYIWMNKYTCICILFVHILWKCIPDFQDIILLNLNFCLSTLLCNKGKRRFNLDLLPLNFQLKKRKKDVIANL